MNRWESASHTLCCPLTTAVLWFIQSSYEFCRTIAVWPVVCKNAANQLMPRPVTQPEEPKKVQQRSAVDKSVELTQKRNLLELKGAQKAHGLAPLN